MAFANSRQQDNQPSARESTGLPTKAGELTARLNSLTRDVRAEHGLASKHLADAVARHHKMLIEHYRPETDRQSWLLEQVADAAARLDHCQFSLRAELDNMADRAELCWNEDRCLAAEETASRLQKTPSRTAARLRETAQGCRWLLARWNALSVPLAEHIPWNDDQCNLAANLMGVGPDLRPSYPALTSSASADDHAALMSEHADAVHSLMVNSLEPLDAKARDLARMGHPLRPSKEFLRLERQEARLRRAYNDALQAFRQDRAEGVTTSEPITCLPSSPEPNPLPSRPENHRPTAPESPPDLETDSPFEGSPVMAMLAALAESVNAVKPSRPSPASPSSASPQSATPRNRKARRALEKAARKRNRQAKSR